MDYDTLERYGNAYYRYFDFFVKICLANLPKKKIPLLSFTNSNDIYTDHDSIVIGLNSPSYVMCQTEEDFICMTLYLLGHEMQHILSSPKKAWNWGLQQGTRMLCMKISEQVEGANKRKFIKDKDFETFERDMRNQGVYVSIHGIKRIVHFIQNSNEDGRIERLRCKKRPGFRNHMIYARGKEWQSDGIDNVPYDVLSDSQKFTIILNQILFQATTSLYQKDFLTYYEGTDLEQTVNELLPYISKAVHSPNCRKCMEYSIELDKAIADLIIKNCTKTDLDKLVDDLQIKGENGVFSGMSSTEETSTGIGNDNVNNGAKSDETEEVSTSGGKSNKVSCDNKNTMPADRSDNDTSASQLENSEKGETKSEGGHINNSLEMSAGERNIGDTCGNVDESEFDRIFEDIEKAMEDAAKAMKGDISVAKSSMVIKKKDKEKMDNSQLVTDLGVADKYPDKVNFTEHKRKYKVSKPMPVDVAGRAENFKAEVNRLFQNKRQPVVRGHMSGNVDASNLYKLVMKQTDFYNKKGKVPEFDGCAYLLQDNSGSMGYGRGSKREYCCEAMAIIEAGFKKHMPIKMTAFDASGNNSVSHEVIKGFDEDLNESCAYNFFLSGRSGSGNKDGYSIRIATKELLERSEKEKILIVSSDGTPSCYRGNGEADVRDAVKEARKAGIRVIGIFYADDYNNSHEAEVFASMYEYDYICTSPDQVETELVNVLKRFVFA